jgi:hypothetical protein
MTDQDDTVEEPLGIKEALNELWNRAKSNMTTSEQMRSISPEMEKWYKIDKKNAETVAAIAEKIDRLNQAKEQERQERAKVKEGVYRGAMQIIGAIFPGRK